MFEITPDDILRLDDVQLRELVARLAAAEAQRHGYSPLCITWGGSQTAADGGLDVRAELPPGANDCGPALPCANIGYQVKKPDMPPSSVTAEMRPKGVLRPIFTELAKVSGAYIIVSSTGSTADGRLQERRQAMRDALHDCVNAGQLYTDFFDRRRLADWVLGHPGVLLWVRNTVGRNLEGWHPFGNWSNPSEAADEPYLVDGRLRIHLGAPSEPDLPVEVAIDRLRQMLLNPPEAVRLVGLSGVGKTRLVQALFDDRIGTHSLPKSEAIYTDLNLNPSPQPVSLATELIAQRRRVILIIDNCGSALHQELAKVCSQPESSISLITVEYDVREDLPERTQVATMDTASVSLIEQLVLRRYHALSTVNAHTIATAADGNARIALAIAGTVSASDNLTRLTSTDLFDRLFWQRQQEDRSLLRAAQALSLVYSFDADDDEGAAAELPRLAKLAGQDVDDMYSFLAELERRELLQRRANWRAVLPHALANYLAGRALDEIPLRRIKEQIVESGNQRLIRSFTRRLSFLHTHPVAIRLCREWLKPGGMLAEVSDLAHIQQDMFQHVASVTPADALVALERVAVSRPRLAFAAWRRQVEVIRAIAYEAGLFDRCIKLLMRITEEEPNCQAVGDVRNVVVSFFQIAKSATHAPVTERFSLISDWLASDKPAIQEIGKAALKQAMSTQISSRYNFTFGARPRDYGYEPASSEDAADWFRLGLRLLDQFAGKNGSKAQFAREQLANCFSTLWGFPLLRDELDALMSKFAAGAFWLDGWTACRRAIRERTDDIASARQLQTLCTRLAPDDLEGEVLSALLPSSVRLNEKPRDEPYADYERRMTVACERLGEQVATRTDVLMNVVPRLLQVGLRVEHFGRGLGRAVLDAATTWRCLVDIWTEIPMRQQNPAMLRGFLAALAEREINLAQQCIDECLAVEALAPVVPALQDSIGWDELGITRMRHLFDAELAPIEEFRYLLGAVRAPEAVQLAAAAILADVAGRPSGFSVAVDTLMRWLSIAQLGDLHELARLRPTCRAVLAHTEFGEALKEIDYELARIAEVALAGTDSSSLAEALIRGMRNAVRYGALFSGYHNELLQVLLKLHPLATLSAVCDGTDDEDRAAAVQLFEDIGAHIENPATHLDPVKLIDWCNLDPQTRYAFALKIVPVVEPSNVLGRTRLTRQARVLLENSPSPKVSLDQIVDRLSPRAWSGSRATVMEANATALDDVLHLFDEGYQIHASHSKASLLEAIAQERDLETERNWTRDERFE